MKNELQLQQYYTQTGPIETIYFGGGTPSLLPVFEIELFLKTISKYYKITKHPEITIEVNPDDVSENYCSELLAIGVNRISIGAQSLHNEDLFFLNRRHTAQQVCYALEYAINAGFKNISVDIMFGLPNQTIEKLQYTINKLLEFNIQHISAYSLTVEPNTPLAKMLDINLQHITQPKNYLTFPTISKHELPHQKYNSLLPNEDEIILLYKFIIDYLTINNFIQYEISNFAKQGYSSHHNSNYWKQLPYIGIGPSAHSFNLRSRKWNINNIEEYCKKIMNNEIYFETEHLTSTQTYNEYILTTLRTMWGANFDKIKQFGEPYYSHFNLTQKKYIEQNLLESKNNALVLTNSGKIISDYIITDFMMLDD